MRAKPSRLSNKVCTINNVATRQTVVWSLTHSFNGHKARPEAAKGPCGHTQRPRGRPAGAQRPQSRRRWSPGGTFAPITSSYIGRRCSADSAVSNSMASYVTRFLTLASLPRTASSRTTRAATSTTNCAPSGASQQRPLLRCCSPAAQLSLCYERQLGQDG
jgi:hypothetical protein